MKPMSPDWDLWTPPESTFWKRFKCWFKGHRFKMLRPVDLYQGDDWQKFHENQKLLMGSPIACEDCGARRKIGDAF